MEFITGIFGLMLGHAIGSAEPEPEVKQPVPVVQQESVTPMTPVKSMQYIAPKMLPAGIRNNNPLNMVWSAWQDKHDPWKGSIGYSLTERESQRLVVFTNPMFGYRAAAINLLNYRDIHGITTLYGITERWAEANTKRYAEFIAGGLGISPDTDISSAMNSPYFLAAMMRQMTHWENGVEYGDYHDSHTLITGAALALTTKGISYEE